jgi:hypothetical protein
MLLPWAATCLLAGLLVFGGSRLVLSWSVFTTGGHRSEASIPQPQGTMHRMKTTNLRGSRREPLAFRWKKAKRRLGTGGPYIQPWLHIIKRSLHTDRPADGACEMRRSWYHNHCYYSCFLRFGSVWPHTKRESTAVMCVKSTAVLHVPSK